MKGIFIDFQTNSEVILPVSIVKNWIEIILPFIFKANFYGCFI